jgi:hypothetical protein
MVIWGLMTSRLFECRSCARSLCCAVATGLAGSQYSVVAGQWRAATANAYPCRVVGCFAFLGVNGNLPCVPLSCMGHMRHTQGWLAHTPRLVSASPNFQPALDRPPASPSQLLPDNLITPDSQLHFSAQLSSKPPTFLPALLTFPTHGCLNLLFLGLTGASFLGCSAVAAAFA